jgi:ABC-type antimicrobial peptide transport system permease subunit
MLVAGHAVPGLLIGIALAAAASRWLSSLLYRTHPLDPATYIGVAGAVVLSVGVAGAIPAYRASRTHPTALLKGE